MGTRGVVGFKLDGKYFATYNHLDSYPSNGLGGEVVRFCNMVTRKDGWDALTKKVKRLILVDERKPARATHIAKYRKYADLMEGVEADWYCLLRGLHNGVILYEIENGNVRHMIDSFEFLRDSLSCEYGYVIDLDTHELHFYRGFNKEAKPTDLPFEFVPSNMGYYPCSLRRVFSLDKLPNNWD
jgi:hypothetical protein